jgi:hypothetical protein
MFGKDWDKRWRETVNYLDGVTTTGLVGTHINTIVTTDEKRKEISKQLSLGWRADGEDDPNFDANTNKRHALRALLLCQRVYYSADTWAKASESHGNSETVGMHPENDLPDDWRQASLNHWRTKTEAQIQDGIRMFEIVPGATAADVQGAAFRSRPNNVALPGNLFLSRADTDTVGCGVICYVGVQGWLVRSGVVSMRWFEQNSSPNGKIGCDLLFGQGMLLWDGPITDDKITEVRRLCNRVPAGFIVHIWSPDNSNWNGHWVISNGNGTISGVNNGEFLAEKAELHQQVQKDYTNMSTLFEQFAGYSAKDLRYDEYTEKYVDTGGRTRARMAVFDPMQLPNRI